MRVDYNLSPTLSDCATKDQDVRHKTQESNGFDKSIRLLGVRSQEIYADFEKGLTESKENEIEKTTKDQDVKYKTKESHCRP